MSISSKERRKIPICEDVEGLSRGWRQIGVVRRFKREQLRLRGTCTCNCTHYTLQRADQQQAGTSQSHR